MSAFYSKKAARLFLAAVSLLAFFAGGVSGLNRERLKVELFAQNGADGDGIGVMSDIAKRATAADNLAFISKKYLGEGDKDLIALGEAAKRLSGSDATDRKLAQNAALDHLALTVYGKLESRDDVGGDDASYARNWYREITSAANRIALDPYNAKAAEYNNILDAFPANVIKTLGFAKYLTTTGGK